MTAPDGDEVARLQQLLDEVLGAPEPAAAAATAADVETQAGGTDAGARTNAGVAVPSGAPGGDAAGKDAAGQDEVPEALYGNVAEFVEDYLSKVVERKLAGGAGSGLFWCSKWWAHPEALSRIYALWRAWETLRVSDPATGMSAWWRDHLDPHLGQLTSEYGPFNRCRPAGDGGDARHYEPRTLPVEGMPDEVLAQFPDE